MTLSLNTKQSANRTIPLWSDAMSKWEFLNVSLALSPKLRIDSQTKQVTEKEKEIDYP